MASSRVTKAELLTREAILAERRRLRRKYRGLYDDVTRILYEHDPMHIGYVRDEYEPETAMILARLDACSSRRELAVAVRDVFREMFSPHMAGSPARYEAVAKDIWRAAQEKATAAGQA